MSAFDDWAKNAECLSKLHPVTLQEAFNAGMTRAAEIAAESIGATRNEIRDAILAARDGK